VQNGLSDLKKHLRTLRETGELEIHERVDLRAWTALGVGGSADLLIRCRSADGLQRALDLLATHGLRWLALGSGSRLVPPDRGLRIPLVNLSGNLGLWDLDMEGTVAGGGANLAQVCRAAARTGLHGAGSLTTSMNSVGGAVRAAAHRKSAIGPAFDWVDLARPGGPPERIHLASNSDAIQILKSILERRIVLRARLRLSGDSLKNGVTASESHRVPVIQRQPRSTFPFLAHPDGSGAGDVLTEAGCLGMTAGGVRVSRRYSNRLFASRGARAVDVARLCREVRARVQERVGTTLEPALFFVDEQGRFIDP
jgi:UDP-N-acetylmuramate dehydrogenase